MKWRNPTPTEIDEDMMRIENGWTPGRAAESAALSAAIRADGGAEASVAMVVCEIDDHRSDMKAREREDRAASRAAKRDALDAARQASTARLIAGCVAAGGQLVTAAGKIDRGVEGVEAALGAEALDPASGSVRGGNESGPDLTPLGEPLGAVGAAIGEHAGGVMDAQRGEHELVADTAEDAAEQRGAQADAMQRVMDRCLERVGDMAQKRHDMRMAILRA